MSERFITRRWSKTRKKIHAMSASEVLRFPSQEYFNCKSTVERFNDAYAGERKYEMSGGKKEPILVTRVL